MTPLPQNPTVTVLVDEVTKLPISFASNVAFDLEVVIVTDRNSFYEIAKGWPFRTDYVETN